MILGIDPGAGGAIALIDPETGELQVIDMPTVEIKRGHRTVHEVSAAYLSSDLATLVDHPRKFVKAYVERVGAMPGQGVSSMFSFGRAAGIIEGVLAGMEIPITFVPPTVWTRAMGVAGGKDGSRKRAAEIYPAQAGLFRRVKDDGRADAALIATWGARQAQ